MKTVKDQKSLHDLAARRGAAVSGKDGVFNAGHQQLRRVILQEQKPPPEAPAPPPKQSEPPPELFQAMNIMTVIAARNSDAMNALADAIKSRPMAWQFEIQRSPDGNMKSVTAKGVT